MFTDYQSAHAPARSPVRRRTPGSCFSPSDAVGTGGRFSPRDRSLPASPLRCTRTLYAHIQIQGSHRNMDTLFHDFSIIFYRIPRPRKLRKAEATNSFGQRSTSESKLIRQKSKNPWPEHIFLNSMSFPGLESKCQIQLLSMTVWTLRGGRLEARKTKSWRLGPMRLICH